MRPFSQILAVAAGFVLAMSAAGYAIVECLHAEIRPNLLIQVTLGIVTFYALALAALIWLLALIERKNNARES